VAGSGDGTGPGPLPDERDELDRRDRLPVPLTSFVGRERAVAEVRELVRRSRLVTLTGPGGVGKTRLAIEVARRRARSAAAVAFADLGSVGERAAVAAAVAEAIGLAAAGPGRAEAALADWVADQSWLVVLDNCEHVAGACAELAAGLLGRCPGLRVLATSRESLGVPGEVVWALPSLWIGRRARTLAATGLAVAPPGGQWLRRSGQPRKPGFTSGPCGAAPRPRLRPMRRPALSDRRQGKSCSSCCGSPSIRPSRDVTVGYQPGGASRRVRGRPRSPGPLARSGRRRRSWQPTAAPPRVRARR
jgi:hypothetical protein